MRSARGFTLVEVVIAVAVVALVATGAVGVSMSARSLAVSTAAARFDALLDAARTAAGEYDGGATIVFEPDAYGDGFTARVYGRRPSTGTLLATDFPALDGRVTLTETQLLGTPAFALALHANGKLGGIKGDVLAGSASGENACPASGNYVLVFAYAGSTAQRTIPCTLQLAATGPVSYDNPPAASPLPTPTVPACAALGCVPSPPPSPNVVTTCPPGYNQTNATSCVPAPTPAPSATPTCPPGYSGTYPNCIALGGFASPTPTASPIAQGSSPDISAAASCSEDDVHGVKMSICAAGASETVQFISTTDSVYISAQVISHVTFVGPGVSNYDYGNSSILLIATNPATGLATTFCLGSTQMNVENSEIAVNSDVLLPFGPGSYGLQLDLSAAADMPLGSSAEGSAAFSYIILQAASGSGSAAATSCPGT
ncbi:MAG TPA: prepilin-type N-terminal cleavage/methylation domain-containing protein [Candidatus Sulfotelmatobacter sp.]|nr:prepilin-type N-terminal cleavage/methylation domain-containing protein [Candidatus Sulfotelmatobacter sp.]